MIQRELHGVPNIPHRDTLRIFHLPQNVECRLVLVFVARERNLRARHKQADRHIKASRARAKVERLQIHRHIERRQIAAHLVLQALFAVSGLLVLKVRRRVVAGPVLQPGIVTIQLDRQVTKRSVPALIA